MSMVLNSLHFRFQKLGGFPQWQGPLTRDLFLSGSRAGAVTHSENRFLQCSRRQCTPCKKSSQIKTEILADSYQGLRFRKPTNVPAKSTWSHTGILHFYKTNFGGRKLEHYSPTSVLLTSELYRAQRRTWAPNFFILFLVRIAGAMCSNIDDCDEGRSSLFFKGDFL